MKKFRKLTLVALAIIFAMPLFNSCKKGDDDPFLSIYSRKSRIAGEWEMTKGTQVQSDNGDVLNWNYNNGSFSVSMDGNSYTGTYTYQFSIEKAGTFKLDQSWTADGSTISTSQEGSWYFLYKNKDNDLKNKEAVAFQTNKTTQSGSGMSYIYTYKGDDLRVFLITELKNKEMKLERDYSYSYSSHNETDKEEYTFELQ